jgi:hypothetical protein
MMDGESTYFLTSKIDFSATYGDLPFLSCQLESEFRLCRLIRTLPPLSLKSTSVSARIALRLPDGVFGVMAFYEKVIKVKADVAAYLN